MSMADRPHAGTFVHRPGCAETLVPSMDREIECGEIGMNDKVHVRVESCTCWGHFHIEVVHPKAIGQCFSFDSRGKSTDEIGEKVGTVIYGWAKTVGLRWVAARKAVLN